MIKKITVFGFLFLCMSLSAQVGYLKTGKNFTNFIFERQDGLVNKVPTAVGDAVEVGFGSLSGKRHFSYEVGITLNEYNATVGTSAARVKWDLYHCGIKSSVLYSFIDTRYYSIGAKLGTNVSKIVYGKQEIDGVLFDVKESVDFKRILVQYLAGLDFKYKVGEQVKFGVGYDFVRSLNATSAADNKFFIHSSLFSAGVYFQINNKLNNKTIEK